VTLTSLTGTFPASILANFGIKKDYEGGLISNEGVARVRRLLSGFKVVDQSVSPQFEGVVGF
jgi:hypothetical protein